MIASSRTGLTRLAMLTLASCAVAACAGHAPIRPATAPTDHAHTNKNTERSETSARRDLAKNDHDSLSPSQAGYYLDVLQGRLLQVLGADTKLSRTTDRIGINFAHRVQFDSGSPRLDAAGCRLLQPLANVLVEFRKTVIAVIVGVDGTIKEGETIAGLRAHAVAACLSKSGIASRRIEIVSTQTANPLPTTSAAAGELELDVELILRDVKNKR